MANRSKKVVISARIEPRLKAALDIAASKLDEKIVTVLESFVEDGLNGIFVESNPFLGGLLPETSQINFMEVFDAVWDEDEVLFKLRAGVIGRKFCGERLSEVAKVVMDSDDFKGDYDLFGDLNGYTAIWGGEIEKQFVNLELVKKEWNRIEEFVTFRDANGLTELSFDFYKVMKGYDN